MAVILSVVARLGCAAVAAAARSGRWSTAAAALIAVNWGLFIYAMAIGHVVEVALGYYIGPLVSVLLGVLVLRERLRPLQWVAVGIAAVAVLVIAVGDGRVPWLGLGLAVSFATYGLIKKTVPLPATASLTAEGVVLAPLAAAYLVILQVAGTGTLTGHGAGHVALLVADRPGHGGAAAALRRRGPAHPAHDAGHAAVPGAYPAVPARRRGRTASRCPPSGGSGSGWCGSRW